MPSIDPKNFVFTDDTRGQQFDDELLASLRSGLRDYLPRVGVELTKRGSRYFAACPMHDDRRPSFAVFGERHETAGCYPCGWQGDVFGFAEWTGRANSFPAAVRHVADVLGVSVADGNTSPPRTANHINSPSPTVTDRDGIESSPSAKAPRDDDSTEAPTTSAKAPATQSPRATSSPSKAQTRPDTKSLCHSDHILPRAIEAARQLIRSWCDHGPKKINECDPDTMPGVLAEVGNGVLDAMLNHGARDYAGVRAYFTGAPDGIIAELVECNQGNSPSPSDCGPLLEIIGEWHRAHRRDVLANKLHRVIERGDDPGPVLREIADLDSSGAHRTRSMIINGVNSYPTIVPPESVILGKNWLRRGDIATLISGAGGGKSVAGTQAAMAWGLGLGYFGIKPPRPLRILLFSGEDDGVTIGQCREGFLEYSKTITGRQLTKADLDQLDGMIRTEFIREHVGEKFHIHLDALLRESPADLVIVNPLLSYIGGEIVAKASEWLRSGLMPSLQKHDCAALVIHHTPKLSKDSWDMIDDTYSGIGGGEIANAPRAVLTLKPTPVDDMCVLTVSKRKTTGWKNGDGKFVGSYFVRRTDNPERPAWVPVDYDEAMEMIADGKGTGGKGGRKVTLEHVTNALATGDMQRQALLDWLMRVCVCSERPARDAVNAAVFSGDIRTYTEANPRGGKPLRWFGLNREEIQ